MNRNFWFFFLLQYFLLRICDKSSLSGFLRPIDTWSFCAFGMFHSFFCRRSRFTLQPGNQNVLLPGVFSKYCSVVFVFNCGERNWRLDVDDLYGNMTTQPIWNGLARLHEALFLQCSDLNWSFQCRKKWWGRARKPKYFKMCSQNKFRKRAMEGKIWGEAH